MLDLVVALLGRLLPNRGVRAGAEPLRQVAADVDLQLGIRDLELLHVGVDGDEVDLVDAGVDHPVDRVQPGAADADDLDLREVRAERPDARVRETRGRFGHRLEVARDRRLRDRRRRRLGHGLWRGNGRFRVRRNRRLDLVLPGRNVLDRRLVRLFRLSGLLALLLLPLRRLGRLEELRERALTHARALSRH